MLFVQSLNTYYYKHERNWEYAQLRNFNINEYDKSKLVEENRT